MRAKGTLISSCAWWWSDPEAHHEAISAIPVLFYPRYSLEDDGIPVLFYPRYSLEDDGMTVTSNIDRILGAG